MFERQIHKAAQICNCICADDVSGDAYTAVARRWRQHVIYEGLQHQYFEIVREFLNFRYKNFIRILYLCFFKHPTDLSIDNEISSCRSASA
jgi:hypothetical protein